jgi:DNA-binding response OmpR family regulator
MRKKRILVIDDDPDLRRLIANELGRLAWEVRTAADAEEGLRAFRRYQPDLVVLDSVLPKDCGWPTLRAIRETSDVPIILLVTRNQSYATEHGLADGADDCLIKPINVHLLAARAKAVLRRAMLPYPATRLQSARTTGTD